METSSQKITVGLDLKIVTGILLAVIVAMLLIWKPWDGTGASERTIEVTGETTISARPDEYVFMPSYQFKNADKTVALAEMTAKSQAVVDGLKKLGVADSQIKNAGNGQEMAIQPYDPEKSELPTYTLSLTVTTTEKLAQQVQDYLLTTTPTGGVTPQYQFSDKKQAELDEKARQAAVKDAREKAGRVAEDMSVSVGKVKRITDGLGFDQPTIDTMAVTLEGRDQSLALQPGENEVRYSVRVVYFIK